MCVYREGLSAGIRGWMVVVRLGALMWEEGEVWGWGGGYEVVVGVRWGSEGMKERE